MHPNLSYITAGKIPPNSVSLLNSKRMKELVKEIRDSNLFDLIILDCPPVLGLSDSLIISSLVDGIVLTVSLNKVDKSLALETLKKLKTTKTPLIGTIANSVKKPINDSLGNNKYNYYSNYRNQYGYAAYKYMPKEIESRYFENDDNQSKEYSLIKIKFLYIGRKKNYKLFFKISLIG